MDKTTIIYKTIARSELTPRNLTSLGQDLWQLCWMDDKVCIFSKKKIEKVTQKLTEHEEAFDKFWKLYPKKVGKRACEIKFMNLDKKVFGNLFAGLDLYLKSWKKYIVTKNLEFIPHPQTWLNQERWTDEVQVSQDSQTLLNIDRAKKEAEAERKKQDLAKAEENEMRKLIDDKIKELQDNDPERLKRIRDKMEEIVKEKTPNLKPDLFNKTVDIHLRVKIKEIYFK